MDAFVRRTYRNREEWLAGRRGGIGASDAAAILGLSKWKSNTDLYTEIVFPESKKDSPPTDAMQFGTNAEEHLRGLFMVENSHRYRVSHHPFDILESKEYPWMRATLDGDIEEISGRRKGILEVKTANCANALAWREWHFDRETKTGRIPQVYFIQVLHQLLVTKWDFTEVYAMLRGLDSQSQIRAYHIEKDSVQDSLGELLEREVFYWREYIEKKKRPPLLLPEL